MFAIIKQWEQPECSTTGEKLNYICYSLTTKCYSVIKMNEINLFAYTALKRELYFNLKKPKIFLS